MSEILKNYEKQSDMESLDDHIYDKFLEYGNFDTLKCFDGDKDFRNEQKDKFLSNEIINPIFDYPTIDIEQFSRYENGLINIKQEILNNTEENEIVKQVYRWRINESIAKARMVKSVAVNDMHRFMRYSEFIYGKPSPEIFDYTVDSIRSNAKKDINSEDIDVRIAAIELLQSLPEVEKPKFTSLPDKSTIDLARDQTASELGDLIIIESDAKKLDATQIQSAFELALDKVGDNNWKVTIDEKTSKTAVSVSQEKMEVTVPAERTVTKGKLEGLIVHEIGTHVARRINGERSSLKLLGLGLDRYESGDEGVATMREQAIANKVTDFKGLEGQLAIGLAAGVDGKPRDFRQVFDILEKYYLYNNLSKGKELLEAHEKAQNSAWNRATRTFRGTDCVTPGVCFTKDIIYSEGNIGVWETIKNNPSEMLRFNIGKYDPTNSRHIWILEQLGISDQDLIDLE